MSEPSQDPVANPTERFTQRALDHVRYLAQEIGPRPSAREGEAKAAAYCEQVMEQSGVNEVHQETFRSGRSTYLPYALTFSLGLVGLAAYLSHPSDATACLAAALNGLGAWGFWRESNLKGNWMRWVLPTGQSRNVLGVLPSIGETRQSVVLVAHLDTHRTPIFYSSPAWLKVFGALVGSGFVSLALGGIVSLVTAATGLHGLRHLLWPGAAMQLFAWALCVHADFTPFAPGANDNASGVGSVLALAERLGQEPLQHTEVRTLNTGGEELGCYGMISFLRTHGEEVRDAFFLDVDIVGIGKPALLIREGLTKPYYPDPDLLELARQVACENVSLFAGEHSGSAYTDMGPVIQQGFRGLVIDSLPAPSTAARERMGYWHQPADTFDKIEPEALRDTHAFVWQLLLTIDKRVTDR